MAQYPNIQGLRYDFSSLELAIDSKKFEWLEGLKALSWNESLEPGEVRGRRAHVIGATRGEYKAEASLELFLDEANEFLAALADPNGNGWGEKFFTLTLTYSESGGQVQTVSLEGCRVKKVDNSQSQGGEALATKFDLFVTMVETNGLRMVSKVKTV